MCDAQLPYKMAVGRGEGRRAPQQLTETLLPSTLDTTARNSIRLAEDGLFQAAVAEFAVTLLSRTWS